MQHFTTRRKFLKTGATAMAVAATCFSFTYKKKMPLLSFSTLGCPDWDYNTILNFAAENNYQGIELRGIQRELDLSKCDAFKTDENIQNSLALAEEKNLKFVDLGSSAEMHHAGEATRQKNLDGAKQFIALAEKLKCPYIRVFPNQLPKDQDKNFTLDTITKNLIELGEYAKNTNVSVLMETHGDLTQSDDILKIMQSAAGAHVGLVWDIVNMWSITKESPALVYEKLKKYIHHTHIKDANIIDGKDNYVLLGKGQTPIFQAIDLLYKNNFPGFYSFEWEKLWHPEIEDSKIALADYPVAIKNHFAQKLN